MNDAARVELPRHEDWRPAQRLIERAKQGVIDDEAAAQELLDLIDPDRVDAQNRAHDDDAALANAAVAPTERPA